MILDRVDGKSLRSLLRSCTAFHDLYERYWRSIFKRIATNTCQTPSLVYQAVRYSLCGGNLRCRLTTHRYRPAALDVPETRLTISHRGQPSLALAILRSQDIRHVADYEGIWWEHINRVTTMSMDVADIAAYIMDPSRQWLSTRHSHELVECALWICQWACAVTFSVDVETAGYLQLAFLTLLGQPLGQNTDMDHESFRIETFKSTFYRLPYSYLVVLNDVSRT